MCRTQVCPRSPGERGVSGGGCLGDHPSGGGRGGLGSPGFGVRGARAGARWGGSAAHTWPPTPVAKGPSEPQRPPSLAPLRSRLTKSLRGKREGARVVGIPPGDPHRCPRGSYLGSALRAAALLGECHDLPRREGGGRGKNDPRAGAPAAPRCRHAAGACSAPCAQRPAPSALRARLTRHPGRVCAPLAPGHSQSAPRMPSLKPGTRAAPRGQERAPFGRS